VNAAQKTDLFWALFTQLDSDQPGEREAALGKIHSLRQKLAWPRFVDLRGVSPEQLKEAEEKRDQAEQNREQWQQAHAARVAENAALARRNAALLSRIAALHSALWVMLNWRMMAAAALTALFVFGGWRVWNAQAAPGHAQTGHSDNSALDAALADMLSRAKWGAGDSAPVAVQVNGSAYWIVIRGTVDPASHADARGRLIVRHCLQLYASEAVRDDGVFIAPSPYLAFGQWMKWPQRAALCRMPGKARYS
jgi:hypothetical protein